MLPRLYIIKISGLHLVLVLALILALYSVNSTQAWAQENNDVKQDQQETNQQSPEKPQPSQDKNTTQQSPENSQPSQDKNTTQQSPENSQPSQDKNITQQSPENSQPSQDKNTTQQSKSTTQTRSSLNIAKPINALTLKKNDLTHYLNNQQIVPLLVGPEEYLTVIATNRSKDIKGVVILLADWQQSASSPKALNYLHQTLPDQGWTSIKVQPANKPENYPSKLLNSAAMAQQNEKILSDYQRRLALLIEELTNKASTYPGIIVMVAQGHHAALAINVYQQTQTTKPSALVMLSSFLDDYINNQTVAENLSQLTLPVLDLYLERDHQLISTATKLRKKHVNQQLKANFRQKSLHNITTGYYPQAILVKEIHGWLRSLGW